MARSLLGLKVGVSLALALVAGSPVSVAASAPSASTAAPSAVGADALAPPGDCPQVMPESLVRNGMVGTGWTVVRGHTPRPFRVRILGILKDGVIAGKDIIMIRVSDLPGYHFIEKAGGIWAGISGSPVYIKGKLVGSVSWGFTAAPSPIGGMTPAEDILDVLDYGSATTSRELLPPSTHVAIPRSLREAAGISADQAATFGRLAIPFAVSGLGADQRTKLQETLNRRGMNVLVVPGSRADAPPSSGVAFATPRPGGNFAGLLSYGDFTAGGIGTTTYVCNGVALAFGHPLNFAGQTDYGASNAGAITIVRDNSFGNYKLANVGAPFGRLDQDRLSGIRTQLGDLPHLTPIRSHQVNVDTGVSRDGETDNTTADFASIAAANHLFINLLSVRDAFNAGTSLQHWTIRGTDANGDPWELKKSNRFASQFALPFDPADNLYAIIETIASNPFEEVSFTDMELNGTVSETYRAYTIEDVMISKNGGAYTHRDHLNLQPGDELSTRVTLRLYRGAFYTVTLPLTVPSDASGISGSFDVVGGRDSFSPCLFDAGNCASSLTELLHELKVAQRNDVLKVSLNTFGGGGVVPTDTGPGDGSTTLASAKLKLDTVVGGQFSISFNIQ